MVPSYKFSMTAKIFSVLILITLLTACNNNSGSDPDFNYNKIVTPDTTKNSQLPALADTTRKAVTQAPVTSATNTTAKDLNPPHGQPGHRCDIAVGAPLNSKPAANTVQPTSPQTVTTTNKTTTAAAPTTKTITAPGMNPPHGEPGHRCDIAVGAPLNSKPVTTSQNQTATTKTVTAPGMNPPHGEPGHRCDIAVGTPLSQPVKTPDQNTKTVSPVVKDSSKN
jgi:hypothetical protein